MDKATKQAIKELIVITGVVSAIMGGIILITVLLFPIRPLATVEQIFAHRNALINACLETEQYSRDECIRIVGDMR